MQEYMSFFVFPVPDPSTGNRALLITGSAGIGKSAVLATWLARKRKSNPDQHFLFHFVGCASGTTGFSFKSSL